MRSPPLHHRPWGQLRVAAVVVAAVLGASVGTLLADGGGAPGAGAGAAGTEAPGAGAGAAGTEATRTARTEAASTDAGGNRAAGSDATQRATAVRVAVTAARCAPGWADREAGHVDLTVDDRSRRTGSAYLFDPYTGRTVARTTGLRPGTGVRVRVDLRPGTYRWNCSLRGLPTRRSAAAVVRQVPVTGPAGPTVQIPVTAAEMAGPIAEYESYVTGQLGVVATEVQRLASAIAAGQLTQAEAAWLTAHTSWERIGAAYDAFSLLGTAFGKLGPAIDGTTAGLQGGTASPTFTGFHKVELDLWGSRDLAAAGADTAQLAASISALAAGFPEATIAPAVLPQRTHEILEDALRDQMTGDDDYGSGTDLASVQAEVTGTRTLLGFLAPLLSSRAPDLVARADTALARLGASVVATQVGGRWVAVTLVPQDQREQVDGDLGATLAILSIVPAVLQVEKTKL